MANQLAENQNLNQNLNFKYMDILPEDILNLVGEFSPIVQCEKHTHKSKYWRARLSQALWDFECKKRYINKSSASYVLSKIAIGDNRKYNKWGYFVRWGTPTAADWQHTGASYKSYRKNSMISLIERFLKEQKQRFIYTNNLDEYMKYCIQTEYIVNLC